MVLIFYLESMCMRMIGYWHCYLFAEMRDYTSENKEKRLILNAEKRKSDGASAHRAQLGQPELIADGNRNETQSGFGHNAHSFHLLQRLEAKAGNTQPSQREGAQQKSRDQIRGDRRQI